MLSIVLQGEDVELLAEKALHWPAQKTIIIADLHWGKSAHFRKNGIAIPSNPQKEDEKRLATIIQAYKAERLIIAGDLFHSKANNETDGFMRWRNVHRSLHVELVSGNHDILPEEQYNSWNIQLHKDSYHHAPFTIAHDSQTHTEHFVIHGHIHPAIRMSGKGQQSIKLTCFAQSNMSLVLPAFGEFTGSHVINEIGYKHIYVVAENKVLQWK